ncbi:Gp49 family protein [Vibrio harveyi]|uniref:Gp49 family protein n=1 Tax=Vibrio harveyi TaxID=669 RepID=UPI0025B027CF|nr:Gp49 family protein [Vibrio harveyi]WJT09275.1 hypothetical protein PH545_24935 [Vibrio harveyi]
MKFKQFKVDTKIQEMMKELGCTGKRVKPDDILARIVDIEFKTVNLCGTDLMYCGIAMQTEDPKRPFVVVGNPSVCIDPDNWRDEIGRQVSFDNTFRDIYKLEAYRKMTATQMPDHPPARDGFSLYESKPIVREAHQLTERDLNAMIIIGDGKKASIKIEGKIIEFAFHCSMNDIKAGDYVVFINDEDTYHCSEEIFKERNKV